MTRPSEAIERLEGGYEQLRRHGTDNGIIRGADLRALLDYVEWLDKSFAHLNDQYHLNVEELIAEIDRLEKKRR